MSGRRLGHPVAGELTVRRSTASDRPGLERLAQLDSSSEPYGHYLLVEEDGELRAAVPATGGTPIADPFHRTDDLVAMLELRVRRLRPAPSSFSARGVRGRVRGWRLVGRSLQAGGTGLPHTAARQP